MRLVAATLLLITALAGGCNRSPFTRGSGPVGLQSGQQSNLAQTQQLQQRLAQLDANNQDLHAQIARMKVVQDENTLLRKQLADMTRKYQTELTARQQVDQQLAGQQASMRQRGGAIISANNSIRDNLAVVDMPGFNVDQEGDVIRIQVPADQLFVSGTAQFNAGAAEVLSQVAGAIEKNYTKQMIGIEGHTDNMPLPLGVTHHQLSVSQALAVFQQLSSGRSLSSSQLFIMGNGANHPRFSNGDQEGRQKNRRIELVIYPESAQ